MKYFVMVLMMFGLAACDNSEPTANKAEITKEKPAVVIENEKNEKKESKYAGKGIYKDVKHFKDSRDLLPK